MSTTRRTFLMTLSAGTAGLSLGAHAQAPAMVDETNPQAAALGYVADATKADTKKFPKYAAGQMCGNCQLYQGKPADATGPCSLFPNKLVASKGWCSAWVKKA